MRMLLSNLNLLATAPDGVAKLRELILTLAVQGKLLPQDASDEPASVLLKKIRAEKDRLIAEGKIKRDKPLAEIAEEEKPFELPVGWEWVRANDLCTLITDGDHLPPPKADSGIPFLVIGDVRDGAIDLQRVSRAVPVEYFAKLDWGKKPLVGDILYTTVGSFGIPVPIAMQQDFCFQRHIALFRPAILDTQGYLALTFRSALIYKQAEAGATGIAQKTVPLSALRNLRIPLPPLAEQSRIVARVEELMRLCDTLSDKARLEATQHAQLVATLLGTLTAASGAGAPDASAPTHSEPADPLHARWQRIAPHFDLLLDRPEAVDALEQTILQLAVRGHLVPQDPQDEPASALLQKIRAEKDRLIAEGKIKRDKPMPPIADEEKPFDLPQGWEWMRLDAIFRVITDGDHLPPPVSDTGIAFLTIGNISAGALNFDDCRSVPQHYFDAIAEYRRPAMGDFLYTVVGASYGRAVVVETDRPFCVQRHIGILKPSVQVNLQYIATLLSSQFIYEQATRSLTGTAQPTIGIRPLRNFLAPLPPLAEQSRIVARVASLRALCADLRQRLTTARTQQALLAEVWVQDVAQS